MKRRNAVTLVAVICIALGVICSLAMSNWNRYPAVHDFLVKVWGEDISPSLFLVLDSFSCNWLLPLCGFMLSIYIGWTPKFMSQLVLNLGGKRVAIDQALKYHRYYYFCELTYCLRFLTQPNKSL